MAVGHSSSCPKRGVSGRTEGSVPECLSFLRTLMPSPSPDVQWIETHAQADSPFLQRRTDAFTSYTDTPQLVQPQKSPATELVTAA